MKIEDMKNKVICGDCLDIMKDMPDNSVDLICTDPPYDEYTHKGGRFGSSSAFGKVDFKALSDYSFIPKLLDICKLWVLVFCPVEALGKIQAIAPDKYVRGIIWDRVNPSPQLSGDRPAQAVEGIALLHKTRKGMSWNGHGKAGIYRYSVEFGKKQHPTQKPRKLIGQLLADFSNKHDLIFDPFFGSGTVGVACKELDRDFIGIEISEKYCKIAEQRLSNTTPCLF